MKNSVRKNGIRDKGAREIAFGEKGGQENYVDKKVISLRKIFKNKEKTNLFVLYLNFVYWMI